VFEGADSPLKDALEDAKSTKWRVSQMVLLSKISLVITIFSFLCSTVSHSLEYDERFTPQLTGLLYIQMTAAIITSIIRLLFYSISKLHLVAKKDILPSTPIWHIWPPAKIISELTLILMHPSPFLVGIQCHLYNTQVPGWYFYHVNDFLTMFVAIKSIYLVFDLTNFSIYSSDRGIRVCKMFGTKHDRLFTMRCLMRDSQFKVVFVFFSLGVGSFGWLFMLAEGPIGRISDDMNGSFLMACWAAISTMTTVGYGDVFPRTVIGRFVMISCAMYFFFFSGIRYGLVVISLVVITFTNLLNMSSNEKQTYTVMKKLEFRG
jgi:hypothetical protein